MNTHATITIDIVRFLFYTGGKALFLLTQFAYPCTLIQVLDRQNSREILRALLHAILFHRLFGTIKSQTFEVLDVTMVRAPPVSDTPRPLLTDVQPGVADPNVQRLVEEKVNAFWKGLESVALKRGEVRPFVTRGSRTN